MTRLLARPFDAAGWVVLACVLVAAGCASREHMSEDYGRQTREFFAKQRVHPTPAEGSPGGLDSEEAAAVRDRYKQSMEPEKNRGQTDMSSQVLLLQESSDGNSKH